MKRLLATIGFAVTVAVFFSGCASYSVGIPSTNGKAYMIKTEGLSQSILLCDATSGKPVCVEQKEK